MRYRELDINNIIRLKSHAGISDKIAARQLKVVSKGFEFLCRPENHIIYVADEVGLGKTYIGLGIAALLRHAATGRGAYRDVMLVPKKNLQDKWLKELRNFAANNYLAADDQHRELVTADGIIRDRLQPIAADSAFAIFRMTSFSSVTTSRNLLRLHLIREVFGSNIWCEMLLNRANDNEHRYFVKDNRGKLLRLVACMLNAMSAKIDCLIVDETHNYKHGLGASNRNVATSLFLGAARDEEILREFPELRERMKFPLARKIICLSATPKDRDIMEIRNQFDCLSRKHPLVKCLDGKEVLAKLPRFLIRGNMEYDLGGEIFSRNQCRHEHRKGNVDLSETAMPIEIGDGFESVFWQLLQYQSIRHLAQKPNASFEIGMLAGFESYQLDMDKRAVQQTDDEGRDIASKEYEIVQHRNQKESEDANVIRNILDSYRKAFTDQPPPHPKLSKLETELSGQMGLQQKSLVFVRRIATVQELVSRLVHRYDQSLVADGMLKFSGKYTRFMTQPVKTMLEDFYNSHDREKIEEALLKISDHKALKRWWTRFMPDSGIALWELAFHCYQKGNDVFRRAVNDVMGGRALTRTATGNIIETLENHYEEFISALRENQTEEITVEEEPVFHRDSFFKRYFSKAYPAGMAFRSRIYRENFFDLNLFLVMSADERFRELANVAAARCNMGMLASEKLKRKRFDLAQEIFREMLMGSQSDLVERRWHVLPELKRNTFMTELLLKHSNGAFQEWVDRYSLLGMETLIRHFMALNAILLSIFQNGSGLLPAFVAGSTGKRFERELIQLIVAKDAPFHFVFLEVMTVLRDYDLIISVNFQHLDPGKISRTLQHMSPVIGASGRDKNRSTIATRFRMPGFPYVLVATDIFHEGEDLHTYCQQVYHYGIAWNPSGIEQRTGRVDRINSLSYRLLNDSGKRDFGNKVQVYYPYLSRSIEVNQVVKLLGHVDAFVQDFYDIAASKQYDSSVALADVVNEADIPIPPDKRLHSKYDVEYFLGLDDN